MFGFVSPRREGIQGHARPPWLLMIVALAMACGTPPTPTVAPTPTPEPDPRVLLQRAGEELLALETVAFTLEHVTGTTVLFPGLEMSGAEGVVQLPDNSLLEIDAEALLMSAFVEISIVTLGEQAYMTDFVSGEWRSVPLDTLPINLAGFGETLAHIVEALDQPRWVETVKVDGKDSHLVAGVVTSANLGGLVPRVGEGFPVELELWLDLASGLLLQARITGQVVATDVPGTVRLLRLREFNVPVSISPPT